jgi:hypothetical protein
MDYKKIILGIVIFVILIFLYHWIFKDAGKKTIFRLKDSNHRHVLTHEKIPSSSIFSWSFWVYIKEYTTKFGSKKNILFIKNPTTGVSNFEIFLGENQNDLNIEIELASSPSTTVHEDLTIERFPIQKWTHVLVSFRNRAMDVYIDGKIVKSNVFSLPYKKPSGNLDIIFNATGNDTDGDAGESDEGYNGFLGTTQYFQRAVQPEEAYAIYKAGYNGGNWLSDLFNKYRLKVAFMEDSTEINSFVL